MDTGFGPFELTVYGKRWNEDRYEEEFPTERWALQRLFEKLEITNVSSYEEMYPIYLEKYTDKQTGERTKGFYIDFPQYTYRKTIEALTN
jgi:hypothetical protein